MFDPDKADIVLEGTKEEIVAHLNSLPERRYRIAITRVLTEEEIKQNHERNPALREAIERMSKRTQEEILADRASILASSPKPCPLPEGKTLDDMVRGKWPGDETDEEIREALERLS
jgi:hypothetical protein